MTTLDVTVAEPAGTDPSPPALRRARSGRTIADLARIETRRITRATAAPAVLGMLMSVGSGSDLQDLRALSMNSPFEVLLLAAVTLICSHRAVTRPRREGSAELVGVTPAPAQLRTAAHLVAVSGPVVLALAVVGLRVAVALDGSTVGSPVLAELAVGPLLVAGGGCLGVLLACVAPQRIVPYLACIAIAVQILSMNSAGLADSGLRWLAFWVEASLWWLLPRPSLAHAAYLAGLTAMAAVGALASHGATRRLAVAGVAAVALTGTAAIAQARQPESVWRAGNAMFAAPHTVQECWTEDGVRYCAFPRFRAVVEHVSSMVAGVRGAVPPERWPDDVVVSQRVTATDLQYATEAHQRLGHHFPDLPAPPVRQPADGAIHPALEFGWSTVQDLGTGVQVAAKVTGLPIVPDPASGEVCSAAGQARSVLALWLAMHATDDAADGLEWLLERIADAAGGAALGAVFAIFENDTYGGFAVSAADARLALALRQRPASEVRALAARHWSTLVDPATTTADAGRLFGLPAPQAPQAPAPFWFEWDGMPLRLGAPCR